MISLLQNISKMIVCKQAEKGEVLMYSQVILLSEFHSIIVALDVVILILFLCYIRHMTKSVPLEVNCAFAIASLLS